jgi:hypothetical protein
LNPYLWAQRADAEVAGASALAALNATKLAKLFQVEGNPAPGHEESVRITTWDMQGKVHEYPVTFKQVNSLPTDRSGSAWWVPF